MDRTKILIVDDSSVNRDVFSVLLEHFGYAVLKARDGWDGVQQARETHPDLILMDICMPILDGIEATEMLMADADTQDIPVIGLSALDDPLTISRAYAVGMRGYLTKPTLPRQVLREIERCLEGSLPPAADGAPPALHAAPRPLRPD